MTQHTSVSAFTLNLIEPPRAIQLWIEGSSLETDEDVSDTVISSSQILHSLRASCKLDIFITLVNKEQWWIRSNGHPERNKHT